MYNYSMTKIFLDGGDSAETKEILDLLGFLDGQTTNPTLVARNPYAAGEKFTQRELWNFYRKIVTDISELIPEGSVSVEVYCDAKTTAEEILQQAEKISDWIPNAHIKIPLTCTGLEAAEKALKKGIRLNITLCFSQEQAAAVYAATRGAKKKDAPLGRSNKVASPRLGLGDVFISPFIGRLDDRGKNGMSLIKNIIKMYGSGDGHVEVLAASIRSYDHFLRSLQLKADIITAPAKILREWAKKGKPLPNKNYKYKSGALKNIPYKNLDLSKSWNKFDIDHELTEKGVESFCKDWNFLII